MYPCRSVVNCSSAMVVSIRYSTIKKKEATRIEYPAIRVTSFGFNSSLSNLHNNVIIYKIKKVVRKVLFVNEFTEFFYSWYKGIIYWRVPVPNVNNTVVSNHFHSVNFFLFSSARSRDFDGLIGIELPVSMYTTKPPIDMCRFNVRSST
jgi:hypothetical protein